MILGIGTDLLDVRRLEKTLSRFGSRFCERIFAAHERERAQARADPARTYAQCFAAKEACSKALGTGLRQGVFWRDMRVDNLPSGKPIMTLTGGAKQRLEELTPPGMEARIDVSLTDERPFAHAVVVISAVPIP